jgi:acetyl esterase
LYRGPREPVARIENKTIPSVQGSCKVRIYTPAGIGPFPVLVYSHGGGWATGSISQYDRVCRYLAHTVPCIVVSVGYRLAPRYKFPVPLEDVHAALRWTYAGAKSMNADPRRIAVGGDSAGGNLSAAVSMMARDRGGPPLVFQLLVIPSTNLSSLDTPSYRENTSRSELSKTAVEIARGLYLRTTEDRYNIYVSPLLAEDLSRLPPALVITGEYDIVRDDGEFYARRLQQAGVPARILRCKGLGHMGKIWAAASEKAREPLDEAVQALRAAFVK